MSFAFDAFIDATDFAGNGNVFGGLSFVGDETTTELSSMKRRSAPSNPPTIMQTSYGNCIEF